MSNLDILKLCYLLGSLSFIVGLKMLGKPDTAKKGNFYAGIGMAIAILGTIFFHQNEAGEKIGNLAWIFGGIAIGTIVGYFAAMKVKMTQMPQMVSLFNGMGGACAALIGIVEMDTHHPEAFGERFIIFLGLMIGTISFAGSMIAYGKLEGKIKDVGSKFQQIFNNTFIFAILALVVFASYDVTFMSSNVIWIIFGASLIYGVLFVMPIGGADMPVVISMLNSYSGWAAAGIGFTLNNHLLLITGALVGASGAILSYIMCKGMNRSIINVILGGFGTDSSSDNTVSSDASDKPVKLSSAEDAAYMMSNANSVIIVPGYGMAVAQAQHSLREMADHLKSQGVKVRYAIHPVAGRMPGHMNVLLAEADVPYEDILEMDEINSDFSSTDVVLVIGANDVVNPAAKDDPASPIYGMPILEAHKAQTVMVIKRSMSTGYAGLDNDLFYMDKTMMIFGDAKKVVEDMTKAINGTGH